MITVAMLRAAGVSDLQIVRVLELEQLERLASRREQNRINQRNYRKANKINDRVIHVSADSADSADTHDRHILKKEESKKERKKVSAKIALPSDFAFIETDYQACRQAGWSDEKIGSEFDRFKDHAAQNARRCADWHAAWRNWVRSPYQTQGKANGHKRETLAEQGRRLAAQFAAKMHGEDGPNGSDSGGDPDAISLSRDQYKLFG